MIAAYRGILARIAAPSASNTTVARDPRIIVPPHARDVRKSFARANVDWLTQLYADRPDLTPGVAI